MLRRTILLILCVLGTFGYYVATPPLNLVESGLIKVEPKILRESEVPTVTLDRPDPIELLGKCLRGITDGSCTLMA